MSGRALGLSVVAVSLVACGPYRVSYRLPSKSGLPTHVETRVHKSGFGAIGGGPLFFLLNPMSPALVDFTGPVDTRSVCPAGFTEVAHHHALEHHMNAAIMSWFLIVNVLHPSTVEWHCLDGDGTAGGSEGNGRDPARVGTE